MFLILGDKHYTIVEICITNEKGIIGILRVDITFYTYPLLTSCRKTKIWLISNQIRFEERHIFSQTPTVEKLSFLLSMTTEDLMKFWLPAVNHLKT